MWNRGCSRKVTLGCSPTSSWWALETYVTGVWFSPIRRPSGKRGGGGGDLIGGEIWPPPPPPPVSFNTARSDGHKNSSRLFRDGGGGSIDKRTARRCYLLTIGRRIHITAMRRRGTGVAAALALKTPTRSDEET